MSDLTKRAMRVVGDEEEDTGVLLKAPLREAGKFAGKAGLQLAEYDLGDPRFQSLKEWGPDVAVGLAVLWCWGSWYVASVEWLQLMLLTAASVVSFGRIYFIRTLKGQLDYFKDENRHFKDSNSELKDVVSSLRMKNENFKSANQDLQCSIAGLEHVREVIETHAAKTNGDFSNILGELQRSVMEQKRIQRNTQQIQERIRNLCEIQSQTMMMNLFSTCQLSDPERGMNREEFDIFVSMLPSSIADKLDSQDGQFTFESIDIHREGVITGTRMRDWVQDITEQILDTEAEEMHPGPVAPRAVSGPPSGGSASKRVCHAIKGDKSYSPAPGGGFCGLWNASRVVSTDSPYQPVPTMIATGSGNGRARPDSRGASPCPRSTGSFTAPPCDAKNRPSPTFGAPSPDLHPGARAAAGRGGDKPGSGSLYTPGEGITQQVRRSSPGRRPSGEGNGQVLEFRSPAPAASASTTSPQERFLQRQASKAAHASSPGNLRSDDCGKWSLQSEDRHPSCSGSTSTAFDCSLNGTLSTTFDSPQVTGSLVRVSSMKAN